jgi:hypothetical protein
MGEFFFIINTINSPTTSLHKSNYTQNPFEINLTIVGVKIRHDFKWDYLNPIQTFRLLQLNL